MPSKEIRLKQLRAGAAALVENVPVDLGDHICLGVPGIALHCLDVTVGEDELIGDAALCRRLWKATFGRPQEASSAWNRSKRKLFCNGRPWSLVKIKLGDPSGGVPHDFFHRSSDPITVGGR